MVNLSLFFHRKKNKLQENGLKCSDNITPLIIHNYVYDILIPVSQVLKQLKKNRFIYCF